ncbi:septum site-determining protein MinC [Candidatus Tachikawaea gelatinosa]|uniref:Probable septum site-determining protein MinC n=1 Tax=Candidatus Tachikawaea gelatinosa TaxID=1410383 RepID=A0A090AS19_9ENTR|nr:septum site-determining protein MinC [Candidatus Tachikawaea gelatinosa]BAP58645.1 probable septum site-determining protein MinC [Candidatus Tachikawaea gelatinosa]
MQIPVQFKGSNFTLFVIYLNRLEPSILYQAIKKKINQAPSFFKNAPVVINISNVNDNQINWKEIKNVFISTGLRIVGVSGCKNLRLKNMILEGGIAILKEGKESIIKKKIIYKNKSHIINNIIRSGQQIYAKHADLVVTTHVSFGAELIADGNIHIYGNMYGRALAGANGDQERQIFCTNLSAELVSIAGKYWSMDDIPIDFFGKSARIFLKKDILSIQQLN